ncbi:MAG: phosphate ABC transporter permease subunit PstC [Thermoplasmatota archaeon]
MPGQRQRKERLTGGGMRMLAVVVVALFIGIFVLLASKSSLLLSRHSLIDLLFSSTWDPQRDTFGLYPVILGTFAVTILSMAIAIPVSLFSAIYLSEYAPRRVRNLFSTFINVLAGIPSVVFGIAALLVLVPFVSDTLGPWLGVETTGMCVFTAGIILAIMVFPIIISLSLGSLRMLPVELREASLSMGMTQWETIKHVLLKAAAPGIISATLLGFGRAFGETMAVAMVIGGKNQLAGLFSAGQTMPSLIVNSFGEMMSIPIEQAALIFVALLLFIIVTGFNVLARIVKTKLKERWKI